MATGDLCQLSDVKSLLNLTVSTDDTLLARLITAASRFFEAQIGQTILSASYTDYIDGGSDRIRQKASVNIFSPTIQLLGTRGWAMNLRHFPVTAVSQVMIDGTVVPARPALVSGDTNNALSTDGYVLVDGYRIEIQGGTYEFTPGISNVQVDYTAGYSAVPKDVEDAVIDLVAWRYRQRDRIGHLSKSIGGETVSYSREAIAPYTQQVIDLYRTVRV